MPPQILTIAGHLRRAFGEGLRLARTQLVVVVPHVAGLALLFATEYGPFAQTLAVLSWLALNFAGLMLLRRPGAAALLSLAIVAVLILISRFKYDVMMLTITFLDLLIIDTDTIQFLGAIFPQLKWSVLIVALLAIPVAVVVWRRDANRVHRLRAAAGVILTAMAITALSIFVPEQPWEPFQGVNHISNFARSAVNAVPQVMGEGWLEAERAAAAPPVETTPEPACTAAGPRPNIVLMLDESSFDVRAAPGVSVPEGYGDYFKSSDGKQRVFVAEGSGGPTWYTELNVLTGLSSRSFGKLRFYLTRIAAGRVNHGLPRALAHCGYRTFSLYPAYGDFLAARHFQASAGIQNFTDMAGLGVTEDQLPDRFYFDKTLELIDAERAKSEAPLFVFMYLTANHFPWTSRWRPDLTPDWKPTANPLEVDEYLRRQTQTAQDYARFREALATRFGNAPFMVVRFGDHQPALSHRILEPDRPALAVAARVMAHDPKYYETYYAIDTVRFRPVDLPPVADRIDAAYLPVVIQRAAGLPLDAAFAAQNSIMERCAGVFYDCGAGAEARHFNRFLIDSGRITGM